MNYYLVALIVFAILLFLTFLASICIYFTRKEENIQRRRNAQRLQTVYIVQQNPPGRQTVWPNRPNQPIIHQPVQPNVQFYWQYLEKDQPPSYFEAVQQNRNR